MGTYSPTRRLPTGKLPLSLLLAALSAALIATLLSLNLIAPEPRSTDAGAEVSNRVTTLARPASGASTARANPNRTTPEPDQHKALILYILHGLAGHPLGIFKSK